MSGRILVLGAAGRLGYAAAAAFRDAGWSVRGLVRPKRAYAVPYGVEPIEAVTRDEAIAAARGCEVVLNALNPVIAKWQQNAMSLLYAAIAAAESNKATLLFAANVWNFGRNMPPLIDEDTPQHATTRKGRMRVEMELRIREACERGMRAIILRAGDFFGGGRGSWFDLVIVKELPRARLTYPGPLNVVHSWAYLPDFAATLVRLAALRAQLPAFETFGFPGQAVTGRELIAAIERVTGRKYNVRQMGWWFLKSFGRLMAIGRELAELEYLWRVPHRIDGTKLAAALGKVPHTPLDQAVAQALRELGYGVPHDAELAAQA
ncbi:MAG TPA: NAD-dependent epimerase/dehydratase family protein [Xanthobacteraceae bacterium]|nr:NAD-dependent epimerase/dehydratase family protein [Xanthobacteraceae bacterium]